MKRSVTASVAASAVAVALSFGAAPSAQQPSRAAAPAAAFVPVTDAMLQHPDPAEWLMWRRTLDSWGYSPLNQITRANVRNLALVWSRGLTPGVQEGTPLVYRGVMYFPNPSNVVQAIDARTGDLKWEYRRKLPDDINKFFPVPSLNRNMAIYGNLIINTSADDFVFGLDATTGRLAWETKILDYTKGAQQTSGPIIVNGKVISGRGCEPKGGPDACVITAHDAKTGAELWRTHTIPKPGEPGDETWGGVPWEERRHVGAWMVPSYDPDLNLIFIGTSVTSPAPKFLIGGADNTHLYHNCTLALDPETGKIVWYYQHIVDHWDLDHPFERLIVETAVTPNREAVRWINPRIRAGERRKVVTGIPGKTGLVYTLDAKTGEFLWATPTVLQTVVSSIDGATGKVTINRDTVFHQKGDTAFVCPNRNTGGKNWPAGAYSPLTNTMYFPLQNLCMEVSADTDKRDVNVLYGLGVKQQIAPNTDKIGTVHAISVETGVTAWKFEQRAATTALVATGGGLLFGGDVNGRFRALDQTSGKVLWEVNLGSAVSGFPITFAVAGKQYVAVSTGMGLATAGAARLSPEVNTSNASSLFVFALP